MFKVKISKITRDDPTLFKFTNLDGTPCNGGTGTGYLPSNGKPGRWMPVLKGELVPCSYGYHMCRVADLVYWIGPALRVVEVRGSRVDVEGQEPKVVVAQYRTIETLSVWTDRVMRLFACDCAEHALLRERSKGWEPDGRCWESIRVARLFADGMATRQQLSAAWDAARGAAWGAALGAALGAVLDAARDTAWGAARGAARGAALDAALGAARDAARDTAWGAARGAARDTERSWQTDRLLAYLNQDDPPPVTYSEGGN